jgi:hypothetical protein
MSSTAAAAAQSALPRSMLKNGAAIAKMSSVRSTACMMPNSTMPARCSHRSTGAISVCSIVPSQRSQEITRLMSSSTADRYAQTSVPISRNSTNFCTSAWSTTPDAPTWLAMNVTASVFTAPYTSQTSSHAQ